MKHNLTFVIVLYTISTKAQFTIDNDSANASFFGADLIPLNNVSFATDTAQYNTSTDNDYKFYDVSNYYFYN